MGEQPLDDKKNKKKSESEKKKSIGFFAFGFVFGGLELFFSPSNEFFH
jgi:hypothetical protein